MREALYRFARSQPWLYDKQHDSMYAGYRHIAHAVLRLGTKLTSVRYRLKPRVRPGDMLNLGSGRSPLQGWITADLNPFSGASLWLDLRDRWPIPNDTVGAVYSRHCMEHFSEHDLRGILQQSYRVLQPGGGIRLGVPSLEVAVQQYVQRDFGFAPWLDQSEPKAKTFVRYITDNGNHPILLDFEYLARLLESVGFTDVNQRAGGDSQVIDSTRLPSGDIAADWVTLYVEGRKRCVQ